MAKQKAPKGWKNPSATAGVLSPVTSQVSFKPQVKLPAQSMFDAIGAAPKPVPVATPSYGVSFKERVSGSLMNPIRNGAQTTATATQPARDAVKGGVAAVKNDPLRFASAAMGVAGLAKTFNQQKPTINAPGNLSLQRENTDIASMRHRSQAANASTMAGAEVNMRNMAGADIGSYMAGVTTAQANRMQGDNAAAAQYDDMQSKQDSANVGITNSEREFNYTTKRSFDEARYNEAMGMQDARRKEGQQMMQSALNYEVGRDASNRDYAEKVKTQEAAARTAAMEQRLRSIMVDQTKPGWEAEYQRQQAAIMAEYFPVKYNGLATN